MVIFYFIILLNGDIGLYSLHKFVFAAAAAATVITVKVFVTVDYFILPGNGSERMIAHDLSTDVLAQLEYPVCMEYMLPPITICGN